VEVRGFTEPDGSEKCEGDTPPRRLRLTGTELILIREIDRKTCR
jgi:hypothetical protein